MSNFDSIIALGVEPTRLESLDIAREYFIAGGYFWNVGILVGNINTIIKELNDFLPDVVERFNLLNSIYNAEQDIVDVEFPQCPNISIDYATMEKSQHINVITTNFGWSDLGNWRSLYTHLDKDFNNNVIISCDVKLVNCMVHVSDENKGVLHGLDNYIVVEKRPRLFACCKEDEQLIKEWSK